MKYWYTSWKCSLFKALVKKIVILGFHFYWVYLKQKGNFKIDTKEFFMVFIYSYFVCVDFASVVLSAAQKYTWFWTVCHNPDMRTSPAWVLLGIGSHLGLEFCLSRKKHKWNQFICFFGLSTTFFWVSVCPVGIELFDFFMTVLLLI